MTDPPVCQIELDARDEAQTEATQKELELDTAEAVLAAAEEDLTDCLES